MGNSYDILGPALTRKNNRLRYKNNENWGGGVGEDWYSTHAILPATDPAFLMTPITRLSPLHAEEWKAFRLQSLKDHPQSFAASFEDEASLSIKEIQDFLGSPHNPIFAIIKEGAILSAAGLSLSMRKNMSHRGTLWGVYTIPSAQRQGYSQKVIQHALDYARTQEISQIYLSVHVENFPAIALYERLGFTAYGVEPKALCVQGQFLDLRLMHKSL